MTLEPMRRRHRVLLYERAGCHLCEEARIMLDAMLGSEGYTRIDIDRDDDLVLRYGFRVPVLNVDGEDQLEAPMTPGDVRHALGSARGRHG